MYVAITKNHQSYRHFNGCSYNFVTLWNLYPMMTWDMPSKAMWPLINIKEGYLLVSLLVVLKSIFIYLFCFISLASSWKIHCAIGPTVAKYHLLLIVISTVICLYSTCVCYEECDWYNYVRAWRFTHRKYKM